MFRRTVVLAETNPKCLTTRPEILYRTVSRVVQSLTVSQRGRGLEIYASTHHRYMLAWLQQRFFLRLRLGTGG